jgi:hypothetical protein
VTTPTGGRPRQEEEGRRRPHYCSAGGQGQGRHGRCSGKYQTEVGASMTHTFTIRIACYSCWHSGGRTATRASGQPCWAWREVLSSSSIARGVQHTSRALRLLRGGDVFFACVFACRTVSCPRAGRIAEGGDQHDHARAADALPARNPCGVAAVQLPGVRDAHHLQLVHGPGLRAADDVMTALAEVHHRQALTGGTQAEAARPARTSSDLCVHHTSHHGARGTCLVHHSSLTTTV